MPQEQPTAVSFDFINEPSVRAVIKDYYEQAIKARDAHAYLGAVVGCGAVAEGVLTWAPKQQEPLARAARKARRVTNYPIENWQLGILLDVAREIGVISDDHQAIREWRNLVHPYRRVEGSPRCDRPLSLSAFRAVARIIEQGGGTASIGTVAPEEMNFGWLIDGQVAGCRGPTSDEDLHFLSNSGVRALVRLAESSKARVTKQDVVAAGMQDCHQPVQDFHPPTLRQLDKILRFISGMIRRGKPVALSCGAGYGRTGTVLACWLIGNGKSADEALRCLTSVRPGSADEKERDPRHRQLDFIQRFARNAGRPNKRMEPTRRDL
jgi:atypical dual specificity phosphatase